MFPCSKYVTEEGQRVVGGVLIGTGLWIAVTFVMRNVLKYLLSWHGWMLNRHGSVNLKTKIWLVSVALMENRSIKRIIHPNNMLYYANIGHFCSPRDPEFWFLDKLYL